MASKDPGSGADSERNECSTDRRKRRLHGRYRTDTGRKTMDRDGGGEFNSTTTCRCRCGECPCARRTYFLYAQKYIVENVCLVGLPFQPPSLGGHRGEPHAELGHCGRHQVLLETQRLASFNTHTHISNCVQRSQHNITVNHHLRPIGASLFLSDFSNSTFFR